MPDQKEPDLLAAYAVETPQDNRRLYATWANSYDVGFAADMDYQMPRVIAELFAQHDTGHTPVLDVGAGTGLVAQYLPDKVIHAVDISAQMLAVAGEKRLYSALIEADLTEALPMSDNIYGGVVSAGTFTHGHVGPQALDELLRVAKPGALFVLGVNDQHFEARGFAEKFTMLETEMTDLRFELLPIYGAGNVGDHKDDQVRIAIFTKR